MHKNKLLLGREAVVFRVLQFFIKVVRPLHRRFNLLGLFFGVASFLAALTPSLVPRPWYLQGLAAGIALVIGYAVGLGVSALYRKWIRKEPPANLKNIAWLAIIIWGLFTSVFELIQSVGRQRELSFLMTGQWEGNAHPAWIIAGILIVTAIVAFVLARIAHFIKAIIVRLHNYFLHNRRVQKLPRTIYRLSVAIIAVLLVGFLVTDAGLRALRDFADGFFARGNSVMSAEYTQPSNPLLSGSDASLVSWESLGNAGRTFIAASPTQAMIQDFNKDKPTMQPIRVYIGIEASDNIREQARLAVKELERTGAFDRQIIQVINTTGSGGIDLAATRPLEYMFAGDIATVAIQYSYFPSWLSLLADRERAQTAAHELVTQINAAREKRQQSAETVPRLYLFGESLGSYGIEAAFPTAKELFAAADKTLLAGPPGFNPLHKDLVAARNPATLSYMPIHPTGKVAFVSKTGGLNGITDKTKVAYLQNATDPVTKWEASIIWKEPAWVREQLKNNEDRFEWHLGVSFVQITTDMILSLKVPEGYGHNYGTQTIPVWAKLAAPPDWNQSQQTKLEELLAALSY